MEKTMKRLLSFVIVAVMVFGMIVPATPLHAHAAEEATDQVAAGKAVAEAAAQLKFPAAGENLDAEDKYFIADCPACGAKDATWLARGEGSGWKNNLIEAAAGNHYYLVGDVTQIQKYSAGTTCVHLNGHNATNETGNAILIQGAGEGSQLNIMGSGVITGGRTDGNPVVANIYGTAPVLNLYGGTVKKQDIRYPMFALGAGRTLNIYAGATLDGTGTINSTNSAGVYVNGGNLNVYGGKVINGLGTNGNDVYAASGNVNIEGAAVIGQMKVGAATVAFNNLTAGADIGVARDTAGKIADGAGQYAGKYIHSYVSGEYVVNARNGNLTYGKATLGQDSNKQAYCPACDAVATWASFTDYNTFNPDGRMHLYLGRAYTDTDNKQFNAGYSGCLHLNGQTLTRTATNAAAVTAANVNVYIMGKGAIVGSRDAGNSILNMYSTNTTVNVYGSALKVASGSTLTGQAIYLDNEILNLGDGASIDLSGTNARAVRLTAATAQLNILGGKIIASSSANAIIEHRAGTVNFEAGLIQTPNSQYPVYVDHDGTSVGTGVFNMNGGKIVSNTAKTTGDIYFNGEGTLNISTGTFSINPSGRAQNGIAAERVRANEDGTFTVLCAEHDACFDIPCAICGFDAYAGHDFQEGTCATCGAAQCEVEGHAMATVAAKEATCTEAGLTEGWACSRCDYAAWEQEEIAAGHKYENGVCTVCGDALCKEGHTPGEITIENDTETSYDKVYTCQVCEQKITTTIQKTTVTDALAFVGETNVAYCPVCKTDVEWTALELNATNTLTGGHFYLTGKGGMAQNANFIKVSGGTNCVHLNGNDIENAAGTMLDFGATSTLNLMGTGNVSTKVNSGCTLNLGWTSTVNVYAGTYFNTGTGPAVQLYTTKDVTIHEDAIIGTEAYPYGINVGGANSVLTVDGATVQTMKVANLQKVTLSGAAKIANLEIAAGKLITLGELTEGADITVNATNAFTVASENAEAYATYFKPVSDEYQVEAVEGALAVTPKPIEYGPELGITDNLVFSPSVANMAWCAVCGEHVEWTAWDGASNLVAGAGKHYYLTQDATANFWFEATGETCLHLNGKNWIREDGVAINVAKNTAGTNSPVLNVLGSGNVSGNGTYGATIYAAKGQLNLYSGNYTKNEAATGGTANVIRLNNNAGMYLGDNVVITDIAPDGLTIYSDTSANVYVVEGATVNGKFSCTGGQSITVSGDAQLSYLVLKNGSKVTVGELTEGAQIAIAINGREGTVVFADNAADYAQYFVAGSPEDYHIIEVDGALALGDHVPEEEIITNATCTAPGQMKLTCTVCKASMVVEIAPTGHNMEVVAGKDATCTETGLTEGLACTRCDYVEIEQEEIGIVAHNYAEGVCTMCGKTQCEIEDHNLEVVAGKDATCTETGLTEGLACTRCGYVEIEQEEIGIVAHNYAEGVCTMCGKTQCEIEDHNLEVVAGKDATCTETGLTEGLACTRCDYVEIEQEEIGIVAHNYAEGPCTMCGKTLCENEGHELVPVLGKEATCLEPGLTTGRACSRCDYVEIEQEEIPVVNHDYDGIPSACKWCGVARCAVVGHDLYPLEGRDATCTETGLTEGALCIYCDYKVNREEIPMLDHNYVEGACTMCGQPEDVPLAITQQPEGVTALAGDAVSVKVVAQGMGLTYQWYYKNANGEKFVLSSNKTNTYSVTMSAALNGRQLYCVVTDQNGETVQSDTVTINLHVHNYVDSFIKEATCEEDAIVLSTCEGCGDSYEWTDEGSALGHNYVDSTCQNCGNTVGALRIEQLIENTTVPKRTTATVTVVATGDGITYRWYYKNANGDQFVTSANATDTYSITLTDAVIGRELYCVVTDQYGQSVQSETVTLQLKQTVGITMQQDNQPVANGEKAIVSVVADGEGLSYRWYYKNADGTKFVASSNTTDTYSITMSKAVNGRQVYCVITDQYGAKVTSEIVTLRNQ